MLSYLLEQQLSDTNLSVGRGEKLSVRKGAGLTAKGRKKYNRATGSKLKAPTKDPKNPRHKSSALVLRTGRAREEKLLVNAGGVDETRTVRKHS